MFTMRFDMRAPEFGAKTADLYQAAIEMSEWAESRGCVSIQVCEHHRSKDGYLPAPMILASAIAARTKTVPLQIAALIVPLHDPIELAEQMSVLDIVSGGRVTYVCAIGYVPAEYAMFGQQMKGRGKRLEESLSVMQRLWNGEEVEYEGRLAKVTPLPHTPGGPPILLGGGVAASARRAARLGLGILGMGTDPNLEQIYLDACKEYGTEPGLCMNPTDGAPMSAFVARDPDEAWAKWGPHLLHDAQAYAEWMGDDIDSATKSIAATVEDLRAENGNYQILSVDEAVEAVRSRGLIMTQPLCGGMPIDYAWESLETIVNDVLPKVQAG
ncbi:MAG: LLM class flavin-dependent oxidoreductase [Myxococcota bacterium]